MADVFIGRQPIFDREMKVYAYELLFRNGGDKSCAGVIDGDSATSQVLLNTLLDIGLENIVGKQRAFINFTRVFLSNPDLIITPPDQMVLEILEDIEPDEAILNTLKTLRERGYVIALDDFIYEEKYQPYIELADIIKIDITVLDQQQITEHARLFKDLGKKLLAEKVETQEEAEMLRALGFDFFQGYFFSKPTLVQGKSITPNQLAVLDLIAKINNPQIEVDELSRVISSDISLSHKVLKFINSPMSGLRAEVESVQQAVVLVGLGTIKNWITILALATGSNKPAELSRTALIRARCCELLAKADKLKKPDGFFTVGLFSALDAMMDQPLQDLLQELPLNSESKATILQHEGLAGEALQCTLAMERGDFSLISFESLNLTELSDAYLQAVQWVDEMGLS